MYSTETNAESVPLWWMIAGEWLNARDAEQDNQVTQQMTPPTLVMENLQRYRIRMMQRTGSTIW